jgi:hypothetical protein
VRTRRIAKSRAAVHVPAVDIRCNGEMFVALLREFARRTAQEHRENLQPAHSQLRLINSIARETLVTTREFSRTHTARARRNSPDVKQKGQWRGSWRHFLSRSWPLPFARLGEAG